MNELAQNIFYKLSTITAWNDLDNQVKDLLTEAINIGIDETLKQASVEYEVTIKLAEVYKLIDEMINSAQKIVEDYLLEKDITDKREEKILRAIGNYYIIALTGLKEKIKINLQLARAKKEFETKFLDGNSLDTLESGGFDKQDIDDIRKLWTWFLNNFNELSK